MSPERMTVLAPPSLSGMTNMALPAFGDGRSDLRCLAPKRPEDAVHGDLEPVRIDRLDEVVDSAEVISRDGVVRMGGDEADLRLCRQALEEGEPRAPRHLDVEKNDVGSLPGDECQSLLHAPHRPEHLDLPVRGQEIAEPGARGGFIVDKQGRGHRLDFCVRN